MRKANWFSANIRSLIGLIVIIYILNFFTMILVFGYASPELIDRMETSLTNVIMFVLGYYFSANHGHPSVKEKENKENETTIKNEDKNSIIDSH